MANPQPEPFIKFSKELFDALLASRMPATHKEIVLAVIRCTYGMFGRKSAPISHSLIRRMTGRADSGIRRSLNALREEGVLIQVAPATFKSPAVWQLNKDYENWGRWSVQSATVVAEGQELAECIQSGSGECHRSGRGDRQILAEGSATVVAPLKTLEDFRELERGADAPRRASSKSKNEPERANELVACYVDYHAELGRTKPDRRRVGQVAKAIGEQLALGAKPHMLKAAIKRLVDEAKSPSLLGLLLADVERNGGPPKSERERRLDELREKCEMYGEVTTAAFAKQQGWEGEWQEVSGVGVA